MIWLIGNKGMLGTEIVNLCKANHIPCIGSDKEVDITDIDALYAFASGRSIHCIVNCSAYTAVDKAEEDFALAFKINHYGVMNIARVAVSLNAVVIHVSTDYVFDGTASVPYTEEDKINPLGVYGKSKAAGEQEIFAICKKYFVVRTAWLYGKHGNNFVHTMLRLFKERDSLNVVCDQSGSPTYANDLAQFLLFLTKQEQYGIYHYTNEGITTWYDFAVQISKTATRKGLLTKECKINPITTDQYPVKAARPKYSVLSNEKIQKELGFSIPEWKEALVRFFDDTSII